MKSIVLALAIVTAVCSAQTLSSCKVIFIERMPEAMDKFISAELVHWGGLTVTTAEKKADCVMSYGERRAKIHVSSTGADSRETTITSERTDQDLPNSPWGLTVAKSAAVELVDRNSDAIVWAGSATDNWSWSKGPKKIAHKLVEQLRHDYKKR